MKWPCLSNTVRHPRAHSVRATLHCLEKDWKRLEATPIPGPALHSPHCPKLTRAQQPTNKITCYLRDNLTAIKTIRIFRFGKSGARKWCSGHSPGLPHGWLRLSPRPGSLKITPGASVCKPRVPGRGQKRSGCGMAGSTRRLISHFRCLSLSSTQSLWQNFKN